jgi:lysophospholipase L1-like esterase
MMNVSRVCDLLDRDDRISTLDRFHPGTNGYAAIAARIAAAF